MKKVLFYILMITGLLSCGQKVEIIDLSGDWLFALDPDDKGVAEQWYNKTLKDSIKLPGSLQEQGFGFDVDTATQWTGQIVDNSYFTAPQYEPYRQKGNIKIPFWLQPDKHYVGVAWYQREIKIPDSWKGRFIELELERTHWETTLYANGKEVRHSDALQTPSRFKIEETGLVKLTLRVDNRVNIPVGINAHSVSDHTQSNWNGITGQIRLASRPAYHIDDVRVYPDIKAKKARIEIDLEGQKPEKGKTEITLKAVSFNADTTLYVQPITIEVSDNKIVTDLDMGEDVLLWSEFHPNLYKLTVELKSADGAETKEVTFGMREFKADGTRFTNNGDSVFLRGTLECCIFPLTGYPPTDTAYWGKIYRRCKEFGLNHVRFHSWCPPEAAFETADREGVYLHVECGAWATVGDGLTVDKWLYAESERIMKEYGNHPSFCIFLYGNEPGGRNQTRFLSRFVEYWKGKDSRRVYTGGAGWPFLSESDFFSSPAPRIQAWGGGLKSIINSKIPSSNYDWRDIIGGTLMPTVSHEIGQWCVYPNFNEIPKYQGVLKAKNFEIFKETLEKNHLGDMAEKFLYASGKLQTLCYKADIEAALRTPGFAGFQLLDLHDFPGQGTALVGVLDPFWDPKGYVTGEEYSQFCNSTVPLARMEKFVYSNNETFRASVEISHFGEKPIKNASVYWRIEDFIPNSIVGVSTVPDQEMFEIPIGGGFKTYDVEATLPGVPMPSQLIFEVLVTDKETGKTYKNGWNFWVFPAEDEMEYEKPYFTTNLRDALSKAEAGANVLFCVPKESLTPETGADIAVGFSSIFWNTAWTRGQAPHTLGIYCDPEHPALRHFPNKGYSDYQWWELVTGCAPLLMDNLPPSLKPIVYIIDDWFTNRRLGLLYEAKVGKGKLMVCGADIYHDLDSRPATRQFRRSIERYMSSDNFKPSEELPGL